MHALRVIINKSHVARRQSIHHTSIACDCHSILPCFALPGFITHFCLHASNFVTICHNCPTHQFKLHLVMIPSALQLSITKGHWCLLASLATPAGCAILTILACLPHWYPHSIWCAISNCLTKGHILLCCHYTPFFL
jgi:hypothetical protein